MPFITYIYPYMSSVYMITTAHPYYAQVIALRQLVLRAPLGLDIYNDDLDAEVNQQIFVAEEGGIVKGCLLLAHKDAQTFKLRQMAVHPSYQRQHIGKDLMEAAAHFARQMGKHKIVLHARREAIPFYEQSGYRVTGDPFYEIGIPHVFMEQSLGLNKS